MRKREKGWKDSISVRWKRETKCSECDLMAILRWGLGVQMLLVTAVQTGYSLSLSQTHTRTEMWKKNKLSSQATGVNTEHSIYKQKSIFIFIQQPRVMDVTVIVVIKIHAAMSLWTKNWPSLSISS